jgi:uridylate kinase
MLHNKMHKNQFNAGQTNTVERFNAELNNQRDQFNAQNQIVIAQSNAQWRRQIATADTAAVNRANELNANAILDISKTAYDNLWTFIR